MVKDDIRDHQRLARLAFIDAMLDINGWISGPQVSKMFSIHRCHAAKQINEYKDLFNSDITYNSSKRKYIPQTAFERNVLRPEVSSSEYLQHLLKVQGYDNNEQHSSEDGDNDLDTAQ